MSGGHQAYPVYVTLANIDKSVRRKTTARATVLLAYLPVNKFLYVKDDDERSRLRRELTHRALERLFQELHDASEKGIVTLCADGRYRRAYPIVAGVMLDNEEQVISSGIIASGCPKCQTTYQNRGSGKLAAPRINHETLCAMHAALEYSDLRQVNALYLQPVWPWWANLPYFDFAGSLMPDILHQLHQGMLVHLLKWTYQAARGQAMVDRYFAVMPTAEGMRHFKQGVSVVKQWTGRESKEVEKQLLPVIASLDSKVWDPDFVKLSRALLDFIYRAQSSRMTEDEVVQLEKTLVEIHQLKYVLRRMNIFKSDSRFNKIVKLHMLSHWSNDTRQMGTADGFSTESPEHMHIESKRAWRASNKVRPTPQMIILLQRYEALRIHRARMDAHLGRLSVEGNRRRRSRVVYGQDEDVPFQPAWEPVAEPSRVNGKSAKAGYANNNEESIGSGFEAREDEDEDEAEDEDNDEDEDEDQQHYPGRMQTAADARRHVVYPNPTLSIAVKPTCGRVRGIDIMGKYGALDLIPALHAYLDEHGTRKLPPNFLPTAYHEYPVWHRLYLRHEALPFDPDWTRRDVIRAHPADDKNECVFDVALILHNRDHFGVHRASPPRLLHLKSFWLIQVPITGYRAGRVRAIFALPPNFHYLCPHPLVFVEEFGPFSTSLSPYHRLHSLSQHLFEGKRRVAVRSAFDIAAACHLAPQFKRLDEDLDLDLLPDLLDVSRYFWLNHYYNRFLYRLIEHWRATAQV
jgi:hypothetical protein